ncbi:hypothetical protein BHM03_00056792 [Ensete ventricosum]|nr:hypothetical protein BHM03_00056792 [Ensete ventricosum]
MATVAGSRGTKVAGGGRGGRGKKRQRRAWLWLQLLRMKAGRVSKAKGAVYVAAGRGGRKRAATVVGSWQWRQSHVVGSGDNRWKKAGDMTLGRGCTEEGVAGRQQQ